MTKEVLILMDNLIGDDELDGVTIRELRVFLGHFQDFVDEVTNQDEDEEEEDDADYLKSQIL